MTVKYTDIVRIIRENTDTPELIGSNVARAYLACDVMTERGVHKDCEHSDAYIAEVLIGAYGPFDTDVDPMAN